MSTYYGYVEREAGDQIDWSVIGSDITKMLQEEVVRREELKSEIDKSTRAYAKTLSEAPTGQHRGASDAVIEFAANAQSARLVQDRLLKSGQLKVKDYLRQRQNLTDGTNTMFAAAKAVQKETAEKIDRMMKDGSGYEMALFKASEGFTNWNNVGAYIDPTSYNVSLGKKIKKETPDGKVYYEMGESPGDYLTVAELYNYATLKMDKIDLEKPMDEIAANIAPVVQTIVKDGKLITVKDATGRILDELKLSGKFNESDVKVVNNFNNALTDAVEELFSNPIENGSIAYDYYGKASNGKNFKFVWTKEEMEASPENIYLEKDPTGGPPTPIFHKGEEDILKKKTKRSIIQRIEQQYLEKTEFKTTLEERKYGADKAKDKRTVQSIMKDWIQLASSASSQDQVNAANQNITGRYSQVASTKQNVVRRIEKDEANNQLTLYFEPQGGGQAVPEKVDLNDPASYIRAVKRVLPLELQNLYTDEQLEKIGFDLWQKDSSGKVGFNRFRSNEGVGQQSVNPADLPYEIGTEDEGYEIKQKIGDRFASFNSSGLFGMGIQNNTEKSEAIAETAQTAIDRFNAGRKIYGERQVNVTSYQEQVGGELKNVFRNDGNAASIGILFDDTKGYSNAIAKFTYNLINMKNGTIKNDAEVRGAFKAFLKEYENALSNDSSIGEDAPYELTISLRGYKYSTAELLDKDGNNAAFNDFIRMVKKMNDSNTQATTTTTTTTQSTSGGATDPFGNPIK